MPARLSSACRLLQLALELKVLLKLGRRLVKPGTAAPMTTMPLQVWVHMHICVNTYNCTCDNEHGQAPVACSCRQLSCVFS